MKLIFLIAVALVVSFWYFRRDRKFRSRDVLEALSDEMKSELNVRTAPGKFEKRIDAIKSNTSASEKILKSMNDAIV